ncbi:MAG: hypothetical protein M1832_004111 [Thelocarpon impressellum]|nr:MAG: hypothetical protein M1832_004111 [Thelocarpon impressellum]
MLSKSAMIGISLLFASLSTVVVTARILTRAIVVRLLGPDDYIIIVAWALAFTFSILIPVQVKAGLGRHAADLTKEEYRDFLRTFWASVLVYTVCLNFTKVSILFQYLRFIVSKPIRKACWVIMALVMIYGIASAFMTIFLCVPVSHFWNKVLDPNGGRCLNTLGLWFANASFNIVSDLAIFILPMRSLYMIHLPKRQKLGLMVVFAMGFFVCCVSILRLQSLYAVSKSNDITTTNVDAATWSTVESQIAIISASLPALRPLVARWFPNLAAPVTGSTASRSGGLPHHGNPQNVHAATASSWTGYRLDSVHKNGKTDNSSDDFDGSIEDGRIKVVTVMAQETEPRSDASSQRNMLTV